MGIGDYFDAKGLTIGQSIINQEKALSRIYKPIQPVINKINKRIYMFKFLKDIKDLKFEVYNNSESSDWDSSTLESRVSDIEEKLDALMAYLKLTTDYTEAVESELIIRKRTKKDEEKDDEVSLPRSWGSMVGC